MKALIQRAMQFRRARAFARYEHACHDPAAAQETALRWLVERSGHTALARRLGATPGQVRSIDDLRRRVPLTSYDEIAPEIDAALRGQPDQLIPGRPSFFALTSGTTGRSKYIPIDDAYRRAFQTPMQHYLYGVVRDHPRAFSAKVLYMVGPPEVEHTPGGAVAGTISGYNYRALPKLLASVGAVPWQVFAVRDPLAQVHATARLALRHDVSFAVAITTAPLAALGTAMRDHADLLLRDLHDGTLTIPTGALTQAERDMLQPFATRDPRRARALTHACSRAGGLTPRVAWPNLALLSCWAHAGAATHLHLFDELYGPGPLRSAVYSATEGWINIPLRDHDPSGALSIESGVYEFEVLDERGEPTGDTLLPHETVVGAEYGIVLSSGCGLFRYRLGDRVRVTGFFHRTPEIMFVRKLGAVLSLAHDMTTEDHVATAVAAVAASGVPLARWVFGPCDGFPPRYRLVVASDGGMSAEAIAARFDAALGHANLGYEADREAAILAPVEVTLLGRAEFDAWEAARRAAVGHQSKPVRFVLTAAELPGAPRGEGAA